MKMKNRIVITMSSLFMSLGMTAQTQTVTVVELHPAPGQFVSNHPKRAGLTRPKKKKSQGIILAISCSNKATSL